MFVPSSTAGEPALQQALQRVFGFQSFRPIQAEAITAALAGAGDVLVVMPTGAGKSLCFQLPAALTPGVTVVVSPLIALMRDQVQSLMARPAFQELGCAYLNSSQSAEEQRSVLRRLRAGGIRLIYLAPERFRSPALLEALQSLPLARFVVDEAHCISEWGHDFRPDYLSLTGVIEALGSPPMMAVTATATARVRDSIVSNLQMRDPSISLGGFNRPNLHYAVYRCDTEKDRLERLKKALPKLAAQGGSSLIYVVTRRQCDDVAALADRALQMVGSHAAAYHAGMEPQERDEAQNRWLSGQAQVIVATNAFGMGIDKPDVRTVVHFGYPESLESYYQEAGRAGRDGKRSRCIILTQFGDKRLREWMIAYDALTADDVASAFVQVQRKLEDGVAAIPRAWWWQMLAWTDTRSRLAMGMLERMELVERVSETPETVLWRSLSDDFPPELLPEIESGLAAKRTERFRRLAEMQQYCRTKGCRGQAILDYFGDPNRSRETGYCCDNCDAPTRQSTTSAQLPGVPMPQTIDPADIYSILQGMDGLRPRVGRAKLADILRGSNSKGMERFRTSPLYGVLAASGQRVVDALLADLLQQGLVERGDEDAYFVYSVTPAGREAWQTRKPIAVRSPLAVAASISGSGARSGRAEASLPPGSPREDPLFEALRRWRRAEAAQKGWAAFRVLPDATLLEIATMLPGSMEELQNVRGMGPQKIQQYGRAVLSVVHQHSDNPEGETGV